ncbi:putative tetratricopeptide-like helical domain-containing protein [Rosa chinensis]|uniref:Putative tetratricopeptide-like helical domain-containing protein n=1 Tax=Rosa chinensis TaxID=74649 RepID=A0A2P6PNW0_ROSCH|nr:putative pentatricopeptide repeat-containing protein At3g18840 [Rosa chinensis]XP_040363703.1 putative pentatricopeptide repeat-containing protein At3g18840 [Rosa chinensis]PRQ23619.1 putative tetratricopeptide-like helical domain-containing protein [Rosa chinensis]
MQSLKEALISLVQSIKSGLTLGIFTSNQLIHRYSRHGLIQDAQKLFDEIPHRNVYSWNAIISTHIRSRNLQQARQLFDTASFKDLVTYNSMLSGYTSTEGYEACALGLFAEMQSRDDRIRVDEVTLTTMLNLSAKLEVVCYGKQLHSCMVRTANDLSGFAVSSLIDMYSKCGCFRYAWRVFSGYRGMVDSVSKNAMVAACCREGKLDMAVDLFWREPEINDTVSWNTMISGYVQNGFVEEALNLFVHMAEDGFRWNEHTFASVLSACSGLRNFKLGKEVHGFVLKNGMSSNPFISSGIVDVYCKCGNMSYAKSVHAAMGIRNSFSITSLISGHTSQGNLVEARLLFDSLAERSMVVWTALFSGYLKSQQFEAVFKLLSEFREKEVIVPDALILISVLGACAIQAALDPGKQIHAYIFRNNIEGDKKLFSALIDMYSKSGNITYAEKIFKSVFDRDIIIYNVILAGYAHHGCETKAIQIFKELLKRGITPDAVTFLALLSACRHSCLVELGEQFFWSMTKDYNILPELDHYACMIDLYGRADQLEKAKALIRNIRIELDTSVWGAFLNACRVNGNTILAREAEERLLELGGGTGDRYVQLANFYAAEGNWKEVGRLRKKMKGKEVKKTAGCSWLYVDNGVHIFISGDKSHPKTDNIYFTLASLTEELYQISGESIEVIF